MKNTNTINGLFHIPDEGSFLKKLILNNPTVYNPDIIVAFKALQEIYPELKLIHKEHYFSLQLPTESPGLSLEAMLITTKDDEQKLFSIYHRLHFDEEMYPDGPRVIEADVFLRLSAVILNVPLDNRSDGLASLLNYQVQEALNIEITMLSLADGDTSIVENNIEPFINNAIGRYMLASTLDDLDYIPPMHVDDLSHLIAGYCDIPLESALIGIEKLVDFSTYVRQSEDIFIPQFGSSTLAMMLLLLEKKTSSAMLEDGSFKTVKDFLLENKKIYKLKDVTGEGELLGNFEQLSDTPPGE